MVSAGSSSLSFRVASAMFEFGRRITIMVKPSCLL